MTETEVVVTIDGRPRPAVVVERKDERTLVRFRDAGGFRQQWVPTADVVAVEGATTRRHLLKPVGLAVLLLLGLALVLYPGGSNKRLAETTPTASAASSPSPSPRATATASTTKAVRAVLFGDSFVSGRALERGKPTAVQVAAKLLGWDATVLGGDGTAFTTGGSRGGSPYGVRLRREIKTAPDILLLQGGASDTNATPEQLTAAAGGALDWLARHYPSTRVVMLGPIAMEQPQDGQLVRVDGTLRKVAAAHQVRYIDPIALHWITAANFSGLISSSGFYPNAAGHAYLGHKLAEALGTA